MHQRQFRVYLSKRDGKTTVYYKYNSNEHCYYRSVTLSVRKISHDASMGLVYLTCFFTIQINHSCRFPYAPMRIDPIHMDVSENSGTPKSSILIWFSIINHPFWGTPIFGNTHINQPYKSHGSVMGYIPTIRSLGFRGNRRMWISSWSHGKGSKLCRLGMVVWCTSKVLW